MVYTAYIVRMRPTTIGLSTSQQVSGTSIEWATLCINYVGLLQPVISRHGIRTVYAVFMRFLTVAQSADQLPLTNVALTAPARLSPFL